MGISAGSAQTPAWSCLCGLARGMALIERLLLGLVLAAGLVLGQRLIRRRQLPPLPLKLSLVALASWIVVPLIEALGPPDRYLRWVALSDTWLLALAGLSLSLWMLMELPAGLGWWRRQPRLVLQLAMLGAGSLITVILANQAGRLDLLGLVTTSAVLTAVLGLAAQEPLKDLLAGLELQLSNEFNLGDWLELEDGRDGLLQSVSWRYSVLRNLDGCHLVIPNRKITEEVVVNRSACGAASNRFEIGLDYGWPPARARALLEEVLNQHPHVLPTPEPRVRIKEFGESAVIYELHAWQREMNRKAMLELRSALQEQVWYALRRAGQTIPFSVVQLHHPRRATASPSEEERLLHAVQALERSDLFGLMSAAEHRELAAASRVVHYGPGEAIVREGEAGDSSYQVLQGRVEVLKSVAPGRQVSVRELEPDALFGEMTLLLDNPRSATVRALEECQLLQLDRSSLQPLLAAHPDLLQRLAHQVSLRQQELDALNRTGSEQHEANLLSKMRRLFNQAVRASSRAED